MEVNDAIRGRRTARQFNGEAVSSEVISELLDVAVWAPNHRMTEPWEFIVVTGPARERFADIRVSLQAAKQADPTRPEVQTALQKLRQDTLNIPVLVFVTTALSDNPEIREEDYAATMMAVQNLLLAATSRGIATSMKTSGFVGNRELYAWLGIPEGRRLAAVVFVGRSDAPPARTRTAAAEKTRWIS